MLAKRYKNLDNLINASFDELVNIKDIGETIAISIRDYFEDSKNMEVIIDALGEVIRDYLSEKSDVSTDFEEYEE